MTNPPSAPGIDADSFNAFELAGWEHQAPNYDGFFGGITSRLVDPLLDAARVGPGARVLDIATGPGYAAARAAQRGASVVGVDVAPAMIRLARELHPALDFRESAADSLPFDDGSFQAAVGNFVVPHLGRPEQSVKEFVRILEPGGRLAAHHLGYARTGPACRCVPGRDRRGGRRPAGRPTRWPTLLPVRGRGTSSRPSCTTAGWPVSRSRRSLFDHHISSADDLWEGFLAATVRISALIVRQPEETRRRIRAAFDRQVADCRRGDRIELSVSVKLATGVTP